jgi:acyl-coenzyme A synthetase/AMP-(fatty) acid ligase
LLLIHRQEGVLNTTRQLPLSTRKPDEVIAFRAGHAVTAGQFFDLAIRLSQQLPGHRYAVNLCQDRFAYLLGFCASTIAGQCTLMPPNRLQKTLDQLTDKFVDSYFLDQDLIGGAIGFNMTNVAVEAPMIPAEQLCAIAFTSGSTGEPSPNLKTWETLCTATAGNASIMLDPDDERVNLVATVPPQHLWGKETTVLFPLLRKVAISDRTPFYPQDIADALASLPPPRGLVSSPVHLKALQKSGVSLVELDRIYSATAPMSGEEAALLESTFNTRVIEVFGCTESGILARRRTAMETPWQLSYLFTMELQSQGVLIKAAHLPGDVLLPDRVELLDGNRFKWLGRHQDMVNIAGKRGSLTDLNRQLLAIDGVLDGVIFQPDDKRDRLAAMVVSRQLGPEDVLSALKPVVDAVFLPRPVYIVSELPRQETGKLPISDVLSLYRRVTSKNKP